MLLTISYTGESATDVGYLLHKSPFRVHSLGQVFGQTHVFYPEISSDRCTAVLTLDIDPILERLRSRSVSTKRSLALREFALGIEALERFIRREPLRRVHECVFGVLALESEPIDPRL